MYQVGLKTKVNFGEPGRPDVSHIFKDPDAVHWQELEKKFPEWMIINFNKRVDNSQYNAKRKAHLWDLVICDVEGYKFKQSSSHEETEAETGKIEVPEKLKKKYREKVPPRHKLIVVGEIENVRPISAADVKRNFSDDAIHECDYDYEVVYVAANQGGRILLTAHVFKQPSENDFQVYEQETAFLQEVKKSKVKMEARPISKFLCKEYGRLIHETKGYEFHNDETMPPALHRIVAYKALMDTTIETIDEIEGN